MRIVRETSVAIPRVFKLIRLQNPENVDVFLGRLCPRSRFTVSSRHICADPDGRASAFWSSVRRPLWMSYRNGALLFSAWLRGNSTCLACELTVSRPFVCSLASSRSGCAMRRTPDPDLPVCLDRTLHPCWPTLHCDPHFRVHLLVSGPSRIADILLGPPGLANVPLGRFRHVVRADRRFRRRPPDHLFSHPLADLH
jgi:hypothetical protein